MPGGGAGSVPKAADTTADSPVLGDRERRTSPRPNRPDRRLAHVKADETHLTERGLFRGAGGQLAAGSQNNRILAIFAGQFRPGAAPDRWRISASSLWR
jgi:hypothetical protein